MNFVITSGVPKEIYPGLIITYKVSPLLGIPMNWVTEITYVNKPFYFVDDQRSGPYSIWHHEHHFEETSQGTLMTDKLFYKVPMGVLGDFIDQLLVSRKVSGIFQYRSKILESGLLSFDL